MDMEKLPNEGIEARIIEVLHTVYDPEIPVDIYELGLIYGIDIDESKKATVRMTLTTPGCPVADILPEEVRQKVLGVPGIEDAAIDLVWDPPWNPTMMSENARLALGF
jgi:FeS assembly SUF system protein